MLPRIYSRRKTYAYSEKPSDEMYVPDFHMHIHVFGAS